MEKKEVVRWQQHQLRFELMPAYSQKTLDAMAEARRISRDPDVKGYSSMEDLKAALDD